MITKITLHNFQCHKNLVLDLGRSTVLQGNSNSGKTAVLRALYWVLFNTPSGDSYVSYWAKGKTKFKDDEYTSVVVEVDGHIVERKRSNDFNGYIVDGKVFEALRTSVPDEVTQIFNLADASVQKQMDAPFLLSSTPGEASQYLNALAGLECVDEILSIAKRKVADTAATLESANDTAEALAKEVRSYGWVPKAEELLSKVSNLEPHIDELSRKAESLRHTIVAYKDIRNYPEIPTWLENGDKSTRIDTLNRSFVTARNYVAAYRTLDRVNPALEAINKLGTLKASKYTEREQRALSNDVRLYRQTLSRLRSVDSSLQAIDNLTPPRTSKWDGKVDSLSKLNSDYLLAVRKVRRSNYALTGIGELEEPGHCKWSETDFSRLLRSIRTFRILSTTMEDLSVRLDKELDSISGTLCPVCGRPMDKDSCLI